MHVVERECSQLAGVRSGAEHLGYLRRQAPTAGRTVRLDAWMNYASSQLPVAVTRTASGARLEKI